MILMGKKAAVLAAVVAVTMLLSSDPALADKLVIFKNGKALLVSTAEQDGQWLKVSFGGDDWMSVPLSSVAEITEADLSPVSRAAAGAPNQVREGEARNYSGRGSANDNNRGGARSLARGNDGDVEVEAGARGAIRGASARSTARTARPSAQQQNNPLIPGLTPIGTNQNQAGRSGLIQRRGRFSDRDQAAEDEQEQPEQEDDN